MRVLDAVRKGARDFAWFFKGVMGEDAYEKYKAHYEAAHATGGPDQPLMTEREFWRDMTDRQESNPQGRCC
jgi:uncharacterized short protein YbdD (DUF466 family)